MSRTLSVYREAWPLARPFAISRGTKEVAEVIVAEVAQDDVLGRGECVPYPRYGETLEGVMASVQACRGAVAERLDRDEILKRLPPGAARNVLDCALWDFEAKMAGRSVAALLGVPTPQPVVTAETIALGTPAAMASAAHALKDRPLLKLKLDARAVIERITAVRQAAPQARLIVDANEAWTPELLGTVLDDLASLGVEMIEQPLPAGTDGDLAGMDSPILLCADESCHTACDLHHVAERYDMVNVKLDKAGGLSPAIRLARAARDNGLAIMVGCMVATSLAIAPAMFLASMADYVDLDGPLWLAHDRSPAIKFERGTIYPPVPALWG